MKPLGAVSSDPVADRFRRLLDPGGKPRSAPSTRARVYVVGGLHAGAHITIDRPPMKIGRSPLSDIVLRDSGVTVNHAEVDFDGARWLIRAAGSDEALPVLQHRQRGRFLRERIDLGHAQLILSQPATETATARYEPHSPHRPLIAALIVGALVSTGLVFAKVHQSFETETVRMPPALAEVDLSAWPDVRVKQMDDGSRQVSGFVQSVEDRQALLAALDWAPNDDVTKLRSGDQVALQLREVLDSESIKVRYVGGGVIRLTGEVADQVEHDRIKWIMTEYENFVSIDNLTEFVPAPREPVRRALPFQIVDVIPGAGGSFGDQDGNRYFIGARLPDGSTLVAVHEEAVEFQLNNVPLIYPIK